MVLPDTALWIALAFEAHAHHGAAQRWRAGLRNEALAFCRLTQQGFLRLASDPAVLGPEALAPDQAWQLYGRLLALSTVTFLPEPGRLEQTWRQLCSGTAHSPKVWRDTYLAAFARCVPCRLVTFDRGFAGYEGLDCAVLQMQQMGADHDG